MSRQALLVALLLALALAVIAAAVFLLPQSAAPDPADVLEEPILRLEPAAVTQIRVVAPGAREAEIIDRTEAGGWRLTLEPLDGATPATQPWPIIPARVRGLLSTLAAARPVAAAPAGSRIPDNAIAVTFRSRAADSILLIDPSPVGGRCLAQADDGPPFLIESTLADVFTSPGPRGWRDTTAIPGVGAETARLSFRGAEGELALSRVGANWTARTGDRIVRAEYAAARALLQAVSGVTVERFIDGPAPDPSTTGFASPRAVIVAETDRRVVEPSGEVRVVTERRQLTIGGPASLTGAEMFATPDEGATVFTVKSSTIPELVVDPAALAERTAASRPAPDVGMIILVSPTGQRGYRREPMGWSELTDGAPRPIDDPAPVEELLAFFTDRIAFEVALKEPSGLTPVATVQLLDFAGDPLETLEVVRAPGGATVVHSFDAPGDDRGVWRIYEGPAPALLTDAPPARN